MDHTLNASLKLVYNRMYRKLKQETEETQINLQNGLVTGETLYLD